MSDSTYLQAKVRKEEEKHRKIFEVWYLNKRNIAHTCRALGIGHMPLRRYIEWWDWHARANERDAQLGVKSNVDDIIISQCVEVVERHKELSRKLIGAGMEYLEENGIDSARDALSAIKLGMEMERKSFMLPDYITEITSATDQELLRRAKELIVAIGDVADAYNTPQVLEGMEKSGAAFDVLPEDVKVMSLPGPDIIEAQILSPLPLASFVTEEEVEIEVECVTD